MVNYNIGDGTYCVGCKNKVRVINQWCKLKHPTFSLGGCNQCGELQRTEVLMSKMDKCPDYIRDPNYWEKDSYG